MVPHVPKTQVEWVFLIAIAGIMLGGSSLVFANEINNVMIKHGVILEEIPDEIHELEQDVKKISTNVIIICTELDVECQR